MKRRSLVLVGLAILYLAALAWWARIPSPVEKTHAEIKAGMTKAEVHAILGVLPEGLDRIVVWFHEGRPAIWVSFDDNGIVTDKGIYTHPGAFARICAWLGW